jgi:NAD(P)-dependent dehydrogenase (short-subunit alcohol dehydrogenase family)
MSGVPDRFLAGRAAWVTGGVTGIGRATALALAAAGANVAIGSLPAEAPLGESYASRPEQDETAAVARALEAHGVGVLARPFDLRDDASVAAFHAAAEAALGPIDILVNAAGVCAQQSMLEADDATWATVIDIDLNGCYRTIRRCFAGMVDRGWGRIVNIGSTAANVGFARHAAYCAAKHALVGLTRCVALEGAAHGVTCNIINPGSVATGLTRLGSARRAA